MDSNFCEPKTWCGAGQGMSRISRDPGCTDGEVVVRGSLKVAEAVRRIWEPVVGREI